MSTKKSKKTAKRSAKKTVAAKVVKKQEEQKREGPGGPRITKGNSTGKYGSPTDFLQATGKKFGPIVFDLAAEKSNAVVPNYFTVEDDAFKQDWAETSRKYAKEEGGARSGLLWLNPPFSHIAPWVRKCLEEARKGAEIALLVPASVGAKWFRDYVFRKADVYYLYGRLIFKGETTPYPKDCMLVHFHPAWDGVVFKEDIWDWKAELEEGDGDGKEAE
jgi:phage N-6-adenine-methyltransferase